MSEWSWVFFGYSVAYLALAAYVGWTVWRMRLARRTLKELQ